MHAQAHTYIHDLFLKLISSSSRIFQIKEYKRKERTNELDYKCMYVCMYVYESVSDKMNKKRRRKYCFVIVFACFVLTCCC